MKPIPTLFLIAAIGIASSGCVVVKPWERDLLARLSADPAERKRAEASLTALGRFLEPKVRRILNKTENQDVRKSGNELLELLRR